MMAMDVESSAKTSSRALAPDGPRWWPDRLRLPDFMHACSSCWTIRTVVEGLLPLVANTGGCGTIPDGILMMTSGRLERRTLVRCCCCGVCCAECGCCGTFSSPWSCGCSLVGDVYAGGSLLLLILPFASSGTTTLSVDDITIGRMKIKGRPGRRRVCG